LSAENRGSVLITGATPVARAIADVLRRQPEPRGVVCVVGHDASPPSSTAGLRYLRADLTNRRDVRDLLFSEDARGVDTIVHGALRLDPPAQDARIHELNVRSTRELLAAAEELGSIQRFVFRSFAGVYRLASDEPILIDEDAALDLSPDAPAGQRSRLEADLNVSTRIANSHMRIAVLRCAEVLAPGCGSQLYDYLSSRVCLRPLGYDPMINVLSVLDAARAAVLAAASSASGVFNVPGRDSLPLSELIHGARRLGVPLPGPLLTPAYRLRSALTSGRFRYALNEARLHYGAILDGSRAQASFGYVPEHSVDLDALFRSAVR
jgi:UDP-glucose 4-epimerase